MAETPLQARDIDLPWTEFDVKFYSNLNEIRISMGKPLSEFPPELAMRFVRLIRKIPKEGGSQLDEDLKQLAQEIVNSHQIWSQLNVDEKISWLRVSMGLAPLITYSIRNARKMEQLSKPNSMRHEDPKIDRTLAMRMEESAKKARAILTEMRELNDHPVSVKEVEPGIEGLKKPIHEANVNFVATLENQDAAVLSSFVDDSNQNFSGKSIFTESESKEHRLKKIHEECDASNQVVGDDTEEEVISDSLESVDFDVQEYEMVKSSIVPVETNIAYNMFDKMSNMGRGLIGINLTLGLDSNLEACLGKPNRNCRILGRHSNELIHEFGYQGFQWDLGVGFMDSLNSRDHILKQMMTISGYDEVFKVLSVELHCGFGDPFESIDSSSSLVLDPGGYFCEVVFGSSKSVDKKVCAQWFTQFSDVFGGSTSDNFVEEPMWRIEEVASFSIVLEANDYAVEFMVILLPYDRGKLIIGKKEGLKFSYDRGKIESLMTMVNVQSVDSGKLNFDVKVGECECFKKEASCRVFVFDPGGPLDQGRVQLNSSHAMILVHRCWVLDGLILVWDPGGSYMSVFLELETVIEVLGSVSKWMSTVLTDIERRKIDVQIIFLVGDSCCRIVLMQ